MSVERTIETMNRHTVLVDTSATTNCIRTAYLSEGALQKIVKKIKSYNFRR